MGLKHSSHGSDNGREFGRRLHHEAHAPRPRQIAASCPARHQDDGQMSVDRDKQFYRNAGVEHALTGADEQEPHVVSQVETDGLAAVAGG